MTNFEESLLRQLKQHTPDPRHALPGPPRRVPVALAGATIVAAGAVAIPSLTGSSPVAQAVTRLPDGSVTITLHDLADVEAANRELRGIGVTNVVVVRAQPPGSCAPQDRFGPSLRIIGIFASPPSAGKDSVVVVRPAAIPAHDTAVITAHKADLRDGSWAMAGAVVPSKDRYCDEASAR